MINKLKNGGKKPISARLAKVNITNTIEILVHDFIVTDSDLTTFLKWHINREIDRLKAKNAINISYKFE